MSSINLNTNFSNRGRIADTTIEFGLSSMAATIPGNALEAIALADVEAQWAAPAGKEWHPAAVLRSEDADDPRVVVSFTLVDQ